MAKLKRTVEIAFIAVAVGLVLIQAATLDLRWREGKRIREEARRI
jgi:hypothetical protein